MVINLQVSRLPKLFEQEGFHQTIVTYTILLVVTIFLSLRNVVSFVHIGQCCLCYAQQNGCLSYKSTRIILCHQSSWSNLKSFLTRHQ